MPEHVGSERPGGRTARTRHAVHQAARELLNEPDGDLSIPAIAAWSSVHSTTIYRRWGSIESLLLDIAIEDINLQAPVPVTGDLEHDLTTYVQTLLRAIREQGHSAFLEILLAAARQATTLDALADLVEPRLSQFQDLLDAAGVTRIDPIRLVEIILAPAYFWAQLGAPLDPDQDADRLIETALLACRG
jgi:AcrR family transcriptional regulator